MDKQPNAKALKLYLKYWRGEPLLTAYSALFSVALALLNTVIPLMVAIILGKFITTQEIAFNLVVLTLCLQLVLLLVCYASDRWGIAILHHHIELKLYEDSFKYLTKQDYSFYADRFSGSLVTQASRFAKIYTIFNDTMFFELLPQALFVLISVGIMTFYSPVIGLSVLAFWLVAEIVVIKFALGRLPIRRAAVAQESAQVGELADALGNSLTIKTFAAEDREYERYRSINILRGQFFLRAWKRAVRNVWLVELFCVFLQVFVLIGGLLAVKYNGLGIATFLLFQVYSFRIIDVIRRSNMIVRQLEVVAGDAQEMTELFELNPTINDPVQPEKSKIKTGNIIFSDVNFRYMDEMGTTQPLFEKLNLNIKSGEKIGLVGPSGGGKTTITRLLLRFMDVQSGKIAIDDQAIDKISQFDLRSSIAYVPQEPMLFHRSIKENIAYGNPGSSDGDVLAAAKKSFADEFIQTLPDKYDTMVGERGVKLSGGQRQRIAIARAMLKQAPILVLDEATSALDSESEKLIQKALWTLMKDKTAVVIAHRLSTIQRMDRIVVLDKGKIVEQGSHNELLAKKGLYAKLWSHQSGGFIEE